MSNETGKEIYKEYCFVIINALDSNIEKERENIKNINKQYLYDANTIYSYLNLCEKDPCKFFELMDLSEIELFARAPKTQMINGHEVVVPRYDVFDINTIRVFIYQPMGEDGVSEVGRHCSIQDFKNIEKFGWFDSEQNALEYAKAHRESK